MKPSGNPCCDLVAVERLEGAREDHAAEVEQRGLDRHSADEEVAGDGVPQLGESRSDSTSTRSSSPWNIAP